MASSDTPELEELLFYQYLTTNYSELYLKAQDVCSAIIIPQYITDPSFITRDVIESHIFQPSLLFIDKHISLNEKYELEFDSNRTMRISCKKDSADDKRVRILNQEDVHDTVRNRSYSILIVEHVIINIAKSKRNSIAPANKLQSTQSLPEQKFSTATASYETSFMFLDSIRQIEPPFAQLRTQLFLYNETYVILPKYVEKALDKLREHRSQFLQHAYQLLHRTTEDRDIELSSEIFITGNIYTKVWPIVLQFNDEKDQNLYNQALKRNRKQLSKSIDINSNKNLAVINELKRLDDLKSAYEKAACIRSALDLAVAAVSMMTVDTRKSSVSYHVSSNAAPVAADETLTAFIDVICQLIGQAYTKDSIHLYAHAYYIEKFRFLPLPQDVDYAFTTYQGALEYLSNSTFTL